MDKMAPGHRSVLQRGMRVSVRASVSNRAARFRTGLVVGETAVIGDDVSILHEVTLGGTGKERGDRHPKVRDGVLLCAGAKVLGNVEIGRDAKVGAGSVVLHNVPPRATVAGVPARIVGWSSGSVPALEMDQSLPDYEI
jgi:serine O-acetyltransferase